MRIHVIVNPHAAYGHAARVWPDIRRSMEHRGLVVNEYFTQGMMHATSIAVECIEDGAATIVCVGGDGTFNEVLNGLMQSRVDSRHLPELALVPVGTGSDLARTLAIPKDPDRAVATIVEGVVRRCDIGKVVFKNPRHQWVRYFANVFDMGLGGKVVRIANRIPKNFGGFLTFLVSSLGALITFQRMYLRVEVDGRFIDQGLMWIVGAANGRYFGGGMYIAPMASIGDGQLEILYVKDTSIFKFIIHVLGKVYDGAHLDYENVHHVSGRQVRIVSDDPCLSEIDGEEEKAHEVVVSVIPDAVGIRVPKDTAVRARDAKQVVREMNATVNRTQRE